MKQFDPYKNVYLTSFTERASARSTFRNELASAIAKLPSTQQLARVDTGSKNEIRLRSKVRGAEVPLAWIKALLKGLGIAIQSQIAPGEPGSASGKYITLQLSNGISLVPSSGKNVGLDFEERLHKKLAEFDKTAPAASPQILSLLSALKISPEDFKTVLYTPGKSAARGKEFAMQTQSVSIGEKIADYILVLTDGTRIPVSIKDASGLTFGGFSYVGAFNETSDHKITTSPHPLDALLADLGFDKARIQEGLQLYLDKKAIPRDWQEIDMHPKADLEKLTTWLRNALGWGYWYARAKQDGTWYTMNLMTQKDLANTITRVTHVTNLAYPGKYKLASAALQYWSKAEQKEKTVVIQIRNDKGKVAPRVISWRFPNH